MKTDFDVGPGQFSPDGRWVAYSSRETGVHELLVEPFPRDGRKWQVSTSGGSFPRWRADGRELFYLSANSKLMVVQTDPRGDFRPQPPRPLFDVLVEPANGNNYPYAVDQSGERFFFVVLEEARANSPLEVVVGWPQLNR